jgi:hypothetical protein
LHRIARAIRPTHWTEMTDLSTVRAVIASDAG